MDKTRDRATDPWRDLVDFESHDLVKRRYRELHDLDLNSATANDITSLFAQGKEYFRNAANADRSVQPLLQYYGVLAINRAITVLLSRGRALSTFKPGHGLSVKDWSGTIAKGLKHLGELEVSIANGMFLELLEATKNWSPLRANSSRINWGVGFEVPKVDTAIQFSALVRSLPDLRSEVVRWTGQPAVFAVLKSVSSSEAEKQITITFEKEISAEAAAILFPPAFLGGQVVAGGSSVTLPANFHPAFEQSYDRPFGIGDPEILPPIGPNVSLNTIGKLTALAYFLGMLVRYYPGAWMTLGRSQPGDAIFPVVSRIITLTQTRYPEAVLDFIDDATSERAKNVKKEKAQAPNPQTKT